MSHGTYCTLYTFATSESHQVEMHDGAALREPENLGEKMETGVVWALDSAASTVSMSDNLCDLANWQAGVI